MMLVGKRIKDLRLERGLSQQELGKMINVTKVSICGYENGTRTPSLETFVILADILGTSTDYLLGREISVVSEDTNKYIASASESDMEIIKELRLKSNLYRRISEDPKRCISLIDKKLSN